MYPLPKGKLLLLADPLIGTGDAPPCIPFVPPVVARFLLLALLQVPSAPRLPVSSPLLSSLARPQGASVLRPAVLPAIVPQSPNAAAPSGTGAVQLRLRQRRDPDQHWRQKW